MPKFDLNQVLSKPQLYTPIDYENLNISTDSVQKAMNGIKDTIHALGYKTIEDKEAEQAALVERLYATQKQIQDLGLSEADSPRDFYAVGATPEQLQEWDRGAKLATGVGLGLVSLPYAITALPEIASTIKWGLSTPMGRKAAAKTAASVLGGELIFQGTEAAKTGLNNSSLGDTKFNYAFAQPALTAMAIAVNPDDVAAKALVKRGATTVAREVLPTYAQSNLRNISGNVVKDTAEKYGDDVILEAFPFRPQYAEGLDDSVSQLAKQAYESEMSSLSGLMTNDGVTRLSGKEITRLGLAKKSGYGNDGQIFLRAAPVEHLEKPRDLVYAAGNDPGFVQKYLLIDDGTTMTGLLSESEYEEILKANKDINDEIQSVLHKLTNSKTKEEYVQNLRYYKYLSDRKLSAGTLHNLSTGTISKKGYKSSDAYARAHLIGQRLLESTKLPTRSRVVDIKDGNIGLMKNLEFEITRPVTILDASGNPVQKIERRIIEPMVLSDKSDIITFPPLEGVMGIQKSTEEFPTYLKRALEQGGDPHIIKTMLNQSAPKSSAVPNTIGKYLRYNGNLLASGAQFYAADATHGMGKVPILVMDTSEGFLKGIGASTNGIFNPTPSIIK